VGLLEFPLSDPGSLSAEEAKTMGILWWTYNPRMPHSWRYVTPEQVEPVRWWSGWGRDAGA
jgi:hypothetical protein